MSNNKTVLLIEDEEEIRTVYKEILEEAGFKVLDAANGLEGLKMALDEQWDLLLLDIMLPGEDGIHILKSLKENERLKLKPVVLLTNLGNESIINETFKFGAEGYLIKSQITPDVIVSEVKQYLEGK